LLRLACAAALCLVEIQDVLARSIGLVRALGSPADIGTATLTGWTGFSDRLYIGGEHWGDPKG